MLILKPPHVYLFIEAVAKNNQSVTWEIEGSPRQFLEEQIGQEIQLLFGMM